MVDTEFEQPRRFVGSLMVAVHVGGRNGALPIYIGSEEDREGTVRLACELAQHKGCEVIEVTQHSPTVTTVTLAALVPCAEAMEARIKSIETVLFCLTHVRPELDSQ